MESLTVFAKILIPRLYLRYAELESLTFGLNTESPPEESLGTLWPYRIYAVRMVSQRLHPWGRSVISPLHVQIETNLAHLLETWSRHCPSMSPGTLALKMLPAWLRIELTQSINWIQRFNLWRASVLMSDTNCNWSVCLFPSMPRGRVLFAFSLFPVLVVCTL